MNYGEKERKNLRRLQDVIKKRIIELDTKKNKKKKGSAVAKTIFPDEQRNGTELVEWYKIY